MCFFNVRSYYVKFLFGVVALMQATIRSLGQAFPTEAAPITADI